MINLSGKCRRCGASIHTLTEGPPVYRAFAECDRCQYRTILRDDPVSLPLKESVARFLSESQVEDLFRQSRDAGELSTSILQAALAAARQLISENRDIAIIGRPICY